MSIRIAPKDFFLQIAAFAALYVSVISLLVLLFQYINVLFPDELLYFYDPFSSSIRFAMASLIIVFPLYLFFTRLVNKELRAHEEKQGGTFRKWLIYITLSAAGATMAGDIIVLLNNFLGGALTVRFALKVLSVLIVAGTGFVYYFLDLRGVWSRNERASIIVGFSTGAMVLAVVLAGFFVIGSPGTQRELRFDQERVDDLQIIQSQVVSFWQQKERIPSTLDELQDPLLGFTALFDPDTGEPYRYRVVEDRTFELCAVFSQPTPVYLRGEPSIIPKDPLGMTGNNWQHDEGETCFERTIDPERFPPIKERAL